MMPTLADYRKLMEDRPEKWSPDDVNYREAGGRDRCARCLHFYERHLDRHGVCELMRSEATDRDGVDPDYVCDFYTRDGEVFPLLEGNREETA